MSTQKWWVDDQTAGLKRYSILAGAHEADIGEAGVAYDLRTALRFAASEDLLKALKLARSFMVSHCGASAAEPLSHIEAAIAKAKGVPEP